MWQYARRTPMRLCPLFRITFHAFVTIFYLQNLLVPAKHTIAQTVQRLPPDPQTSLQILLTSTSCTEGLAVVWLRKVGKVCCSKEDNKQEVGQFLAVEYENIKQLKKRQGWWMSRLEDSRLKRERIRGERSHSKIRYMGDLAKEVRPKIVIALRWLQKMRLDFIFSHG